MDPNYNSRQQKLYSDYTLKSDQQLLDILSNEEKYSREVMEIVIAILEERGKLPKNIKEERQKNQESETIYNFAGNLLFKMNKSPEEAIQLLVESGIDSGIARSVINNILSKVKEEKKASRNNKMLYGGLWFVGGIVVTAITYSYAEAGDTYLVASGAIVYGGIQFFRGVFNK